MEKATDRLAKMTVEEKIGQLIITAVDSTKLNDMNRALIERHRIGGVVFSPSNIKSEEQTIEFIKSLKQLSALGSEIPMFFALDEVGGQHSNFPESMTKTPSPQTIGEIGDVQRAFDSGKQIATNMRSLGFDLELAPVANIKFGEIHDELDHAIFAPEPLQTADMVKRFLYGLREAKVISAAKYFPVSTGTEELHISEDIERMKARELLPFKALADEKVEMIIVSHSFVDSLDKEYPVSLSEVAKKELLEAIGYEGIVLSDSITKPVIRERYGAEKAAVTALRSGCDMILIGDFKQTPAIAKELVQAVKEEQISIEKIDKAVLKVLMMKEKI
ncbi:MAG: glycoside hydrolase family 3 N-terminal domain-containing protein [Peptostreptococcaceae bacterium]|nr:glycoside hydrolase family 3 N-terminal domain-containing protein [Peptostreptococcaceae bacterium]